MKLHSVKVPKLMQLYFHKLKWCPACVTRKLIIGKKLKRLRYSLRAARMAFLKVWRS